MKRRFFRQPTKGLLHIALLTAAELVALAACHPVAAQQADGERLFRQRCAACHSLDEGGRSTGPNLFAILGREAGSLEGAAYSQAMQDSDLVWDEETLERFLANPTALVPGTRMAVRITNDDQRTAIITYLKAVGGDS